MRDGCFLAVMLEENRWTVNRANIDGHERLGIRIG